jgi:hypothetical protein
VSLQKKNSYSAGNYLIMDEEYTGGMVNGYSAGKYQPRDEASAGEKWDSAGNY